MEALSLVSRSSSSATVSTNLGERTIPSLNTWNNTAFARLCMDGMPEDQLNMLAHNPELSADKREIATGKLEELYGVTTGNQV